MDPLLVNSNASASVAGFHTAVAVILIEQDAVLMGKRTPQRSWAPGRWGLPGGHVERGEGEPEALLREAREELGIALARETASLVGRLVGPNYDVAYYATARWDGTPYNAEPQEHSELRWMTERELTRADLADASALPIILRALRRPSANQLVS